MKNQLMIKRASDPRYSTTANINQSTYRTKTISKSKGFLDVMSINIHLNKRNILRYRDISSIDLRSMSNPMLPVYNSWLVVFSRS